MATPVLPKSRPAPAIEAPNIAPATAKQRASSPGSIRARLIGPLALAEVALSCAAVVGSGVFLATLLHGRTALFWPSFAWAATFGASVLVVVLLWWLGSLTRRRAGWRAWHAAGWPILSLLPPALASFAIYADDASNHFITRYPPTNQALVVYGVGLFVLAESGFWLSVLARRGNTAWRPSRSSLPPVLFGVSVAAYVNASLYLQWIPRQTDLHVNLQGARDLLSGTSPYHDNVPVWADRVHLLPVTLALLFGPLAALPEETAHVLFFLANQALWLVAMWLLIRRLVPPTRRLFWYAGTLLFGAIYWPWQESIHFGQQDGLIVLLFVVSLTAIAQKREVEGGLALGLGLIVKPLSIWLPLVYLLHGRWRALLIAGLAGAALTLAALPFTGLEPWLHFVRVELPAMLPGTVRGTNIPLPSLHARMFVGREALGDGEPAPTLAVISALNVAANLLGLLLVTRLGLNRKSEGGRDWLLDASLGLCLTLLLAPMAWQHYSSWLCIAFFMLALPAVWQPLRVPARAAVAALAGLGFLLLSLEDGHLLQLLTPLVDQWPSVMGFYTVGLLSVTAAVAVARLAGSEAPAA